MERSGFHVFFLQWTIVCSLLARVIDHPPTPYHHHLLILTDDTESLEVWPRLKRRMCSGTPFHSWENGNIISSHSKNLCMPTQDSLWQDRNRLLHLLFLSSFQASLPMNHINWENSLGSQCGAMCFPEQINVCKICDVFIYLLIYPSAQNPKDDSIGRKKNG